MKTNDDDVIAKAKRCIEYGHSQAFDLLLCKYFRGKVSMDQNGREIADLYVRVNGRGCDRLYYDAFAIDHYGNVSFKFDCSITFIPDWVEIPKQEYDSKRKELVEFLAERPESRANVSFKPFH